MTRVRPNLAAGAGRAGCPSSMLVGSACVQGAGSLCHKATLQKGSGAARKSRGDGHQAPQQQLDGVNLGKGSGHQNALKPPAAACFQAGQASHCCWSDASGAQRFLAKPARAGLLTARRGALTSRGGPIRRARLQTDDSTKAAYQHAGDGARSHLRPRALRSPAFLDAACSCARARRPPPHGWAAGTTPASRAQLSWAGLG